MKIGLITDMHLGYVRGTRENAQGVNVREQDVLDAATAAVTNLTMNRAEVIVDLGDIAHVPAPKKRALVHLIDLINNSGLQWFSANGNHTLQRTKSDLHLYEVLQHYCPKFTGYTEPTFVEGIGAYLIPYGTEVQALRDVPPDAQFIGGHFACDDVPFPGEHVSVGDLPKEIPAFLGHYHTRKANITVATEALESSGPYDMYKRYEPGPREWAYEGPTYIGATERFAWGEANNPTGVAIFDTDTKAIQFIDHPTREWMHIDAKAEEVMDVLGGRDFEGKIVRVEVEGTAPEFHAIPIDEIRTLAKGALEFQIKRVGDTIAFDPQHNDSTTYDLIDRWHRHVGSIKQRKEFKEAMRWIGDQALQRAGVGE